MGARLGAVDLLSSIVDALRGRRLLLILDNCEHLASTVAAAIERILADVPEASIIATSREPLRVAQEDVYRMPVLEAPMGDGDMSAVEALDFPAIRLFVTRAAERSGYVFADADTRIVAAICRRLDGIALAIELAASKTVTFDVSTLLNMLEQRFSVLCHGPRDAPLRQQTLLATLDWSYRLLSEKEATTLRFLSVFVGYFGLDDAVAMSVAAGLGHSQAIDALGQLVAKSLVAEDYQDGALRYRLLESTRAYAAERLASEAEEIRAMDHYARLVLSLFERAEGEWSWRVKRDWMGDYAGRIGDLRKVLAWAHGPAGNKNLSVRLTAAAIPLWDELASVSEARSRVDEARTVVGEIGDYVADVRMKLATAHAWSMTFDQHLVPETETAWRDCVRFAAEVQSTEYQLRGLWGLSVYLLYTGRLAEAVAQLDRFREMATTVQDWSALPDGERLLANAETYAGRLDSAARRLEALAAQHGKLEERSRIARFQVDRYVAIRCSLAFLLWLNGTPARAAQVAREAVEGAHCLGHLVSHSNALALGALPVAFWSGDFDSAAVFQAMLDENARRENIAIWGPVSSFFRGAIRAAKGESGGIAEMREGLARLVEGRFLLRVPMYYCMLAEALLSIGEIEQARLSLSEARSRARVQGERWCVAEILRIEGLIGLRSGDAKAAEQSLVRALHEAQQIGALSLELRAALVLSDKWIMDGRDEDSWKLLNATLAKFEEGFGSADLVEARARLGRFREAMPPAEAMRA